MTEAEALAFIERHGVVLASAKGPVPRLAEMLVGEPIKGSWWAHPKSHELFRVFEAVGASPDILTCRLVGGKVTYVHRRLWPALVRAAGRFPSDHVARVDQEHTRAGHHINTQVPCPDWADPTTQVEAARLSEEQALDALGITPMPPPSSHGSRRAAGTA